MEKQSPEKKPEPEKKPKKDVVEPIIAGAAEAKRKVFRAERPIPGGVYPVIDTDLGRDNIENDIPAADLSEL